MAENIINKNAGETFISDYQRYAVYITYKRVLPGIRDGLKCVNRRIVYCMYKDTKVYPGSPDRKVKSSAVIGEVMKKYHPNGDTGVYSAMLSMGSWYSCKVPLIMSQGNMGSPQGGHDEASNQRYTEAGLTQFAYDIYIDDIVKSQNCIDYTENYDGRYMEPEYLPCKIPILLVNGCFGIAVGTKCEISSHNLGEVIDATLQLMDNPNSEIILIPDHCQECYIVDDTDWKSLCDLGFGYYKIRSRIDIEDYKGKKALVIKSTHDLLYLNSITDDIENLVAKKKLVQIENCFDESSLGPNGKEQLRYVIVLKSGSNAEYVREVLYKNTKLEDRIRENFLVLNGLEPIRLSYKGYILSWIDFRRMTKFRIYSNMLQQIQTKLHEKEAYIKILESGEIDTVLKKIMSQKTIDDEGLTEWLIKKFKITDLQASYIINVNTKKLSIGYLNKYKEEAKELNSEMKEVMKKLSNDSYIDQEIREELLYIKNKYNTPRTCKLIRANKVSDDVPAGMMTIITTDKNIIKKFPEGVNVKLNRNESAKSFIKIDNRDNLILFDDIGKAYKIPVNNIPLSDKANDGIDVKILAKGMISTIVGVQSEENIRVLDKQNQTNESTYIVVITRAGMVKKILLTELLNITGSGLVYSKVDQNDRVESVFLSSAGVDTIIYSDHKAIRLSINDIPTQKRNSRGMKSMNTDKIDGIAIISPITKDIVVITDGNKINRVPIDALPRDKRAKNGFNVIKLGKDDKIKTILAINNNDREVLRVVNTEETVDVPVREIPYGSSISPGIKIFKKKLPILQVTVYNT